MILTIDPDLIGLLQAFLQLISVFIQFSSAEVLKHIPTDQLNEQRNSVGDAA